MDVTKILLLIAGLCLIGGLICEYLARREEKRK